MLREGGGSVEGMWKRKRNEIRNALIASYVKQKNESVPQRVLVLGNTFS